MKVSIFTGSIKESDNTIALAKQIFNGLSKSGITCELINIKDFNIPPCEECEECNLITDICLQISDMPTVYKKMEKSEVLIFGTPVYWLGNEKHILLDRFKPFIINKRLSGKKAALISPKSTIKGDSSTSIIEFKRLFKALELEYLGNITADNYVLDDEQKEDKPIHSFIRDLTYRILESSN